MHSITKPFPAVPRISSEYIRIYIQDILYNPNLIQLTPDALPEAVGVWVLCMTHCQVSGHIPMDSTRLARLLRISEKPVQRAWPHISFDFEEADAQHYGHPRIDAERQEAVALSEKRRQSALSMWKNSPGEVSGEDPVVPGRRNSRRKASVGKPVDLSRNPMAMRLLDAWNQMAESTGSKIARASNLDFPVDMESVVEDLGGEGRILEAIQRIPKIPFYLGAGPHGWRASFPWVLQRKSIANLLAQTPISKGGSASESADLSDADRALLDQLREDTPVPQEGF